MRSGSLARLVLAIAFGVGIATAAAAQEADDIEIESLTQRTNLFFESLSSQVDQKAAFDNLIQGGPLSVAERDGDVLELVERHKRLLEKYGARVGEPERISVKRFGQDLVLLKYLYKTENFPIVWYFTYYRPHPEESLPREGWFVVSLRFDTRLELLDLTE